MLGRAVRLILTNIGGGVPGEVDKATHGFPGKYTLCFGEDEEHSPWAPLHVERGFDAAQSTVTVLSVNSTLNILTSSFIHINDMLDRMVDALSVTATNNAMLGKGEPVLLIASGHADLCVRQGMRKLDAKRYLYERCGFPESRLPADMVRRERDSRRHCRTVSSARCAAPKTSCSLSPAAPSPTTPPSCPPSATRSR